MPAPPVAALSSRSPRSGSEPPRGGALVRTAPGHRLAHLHVHLDRSTHPRRRGCQCVPAPPARYRLPRRPRRRHLTPTLPGGRRGTHRVRAPQSAVRRRRVAIVSVGCVAALLLLWLSFAVPPPWPWWVRAAAFVAIPASFFTTIAVELSVTAARTERGLSPQEGRRRRLAAWREVAHDITPLITWPWLYVRPLHRARERWRTHPRKRPPDGP